MNTTITTIDQYIAQQPRSNQEILQKIRKIIQQAAPDAKEKIGYGIPTFTLKGNVIHFAGYKNHIGIYPTSAGVVAFMPELSGYNTSKGTIQLPLDKPIPYDLIKKIADFCVENNRNKIK